MSKMMSKTKTVSAKHIPLRTCVSCRKTKEKPELIRLVHGSDGNISVDSNGKKTGRGAYLCRELKCWETALNSNKIEYNLHCRVTAINRERLVTEVKDILQGAISG